jgi:hypothetical protein
MTHGITVINTVIIGMPFFAIKMKECARLREGVPYVKVYRYNPKHLCTKLNDYGDNGERHLAARVGTIRNTGMIQ